MIDLWADFFPKEHCVNSSYLPLFGQILAALYQNDVVEEDDIRTWHNSAESKAQNAQNESMKRCWMVGGKMIEQFDDQASSDEDDSDEE
jgi:translation initiation factor eIF-2B subunit epsilon